MIFPKITPVMVHDQLRMSLISPIKLSSSLGDMFGPSRWIEHAGYLEKMRIRHDIQKIIASYMINNKPILKVFPELLCIMGIHSLILFPPYLKVFIGFPKTNPPLMSATLSFPADRGFALRPWNQAGLSWDRGMVGYCHGAMLGNLSVSAMGIHHCFCWDLLINYGIYHVYYGWLLWDLLINYGNIWQLWWFFMGDHGDSPCFFCIFQQWTTTWSRSSDAAPGSQVRFDNAKISIRGDKAQAMGQIRVVDACEILTSWYPAW